ncbi:TSUP family transporter [Mangrovibrevibacter kandeliae]|uniref:TSUP family transporter n=1 Tax=Mangrovibrevibacter kandeliae TaxID=2968473 RepID=UPI002117F678|nr:MULTISPECIES: TSUP family transporter [unclassified Aurantimonas]MCQ8784347.1 TSUP family transporter [Aurantimonas sp. CSK15Z-1]MCW4117131.1 TSUP family transporter [Aurantimonas sp. MSK8Z-1]
MLDPTFAFITGAALFAGFVDAIAGGGGLITIPAMLIGGIDPFTALGTNKLQGLFGSGSASIAYASKGHVDLRRLLPVALLSGLGAVGGALGAMVLPVEVLEGLLPYLLVAVALYFAVKPGLSDRDAERRVSPRLFALTVVPLIGAYDGLFGPGTGSFFMLAFVTLAGHGVLKATAHTKLLNFASNIGGFSVFAVSGVIDWRLGLAMGGAQFLGARLGAMLAMRLGVRLIRPLLVTVCLCLAAKLLLA